MPKILSHKITPPKPFTLRQFYEKRNTVLIVRAAGGLGDILMHRMIFENFKRVMPECRLIFALPEMYFPAVIDHPHIDQILNCKSVSVQDYLIWYDTTYNCHRYESAKAPFSDKHRSDIWANHCGLKLETHNMNIRFTSKERAFGEELVGSHCNGKKTVAFCPISAMTVKNLLMHQQKAAVDYLRSQGLTVLGLHDRPVAELEALKVPVLTGLTIRQWMSILNAVDYVVSVDSAAFHFAGGIRKPLTGIFTAFDGKVYGKYYKFNLVQLHRDNGNWDCGPCYDWGGCPKSTKHPKPCLTELTGEMITDGIRRMLDGNVNKSRTLPVLNRFEYSETIG